MTIEKLKSYRGICAEIKDIKSKLSGSYVGDTVQSGSKHPYSVHNVHIEGLVPSGNTVSLLARLSVLEHSREEIEEFVHDIDDDDYEIKQIIQYRFMRGKKPISWQRIAIKLGYCSEHTPNRKLKKYFENGGNGGF